LVLYDPSRRPPISDQQRHKIRKVTPIFSSVEGGVRITTQATALTGAYVCVVPFLHTEVL
jgi:hypothetical protein